jgi:tetratricopeptide (TPR) repeat protein
MIKNILLLTVLCCIIFSLPVSAQSAKTKPVKSIAAGKKVDSTKLKSDIQGLYDNNKHNEVIVKANQYLLKFPKDTLINMQKANSHIALKQFASGFALMKKFFTPADTAAKYIAFMSFSVPKNDLLTTGIICADESIKLSPNGPYGYFVKGGIYSDLGQHEKALPLMELANSKIRDDNERNLLSVYYAKELAFNNQHEKAVALINDLYIKYPGDKEIIYQFAIIYRLNESYDKAAEKYDELLKLAPENIDYHLGKAAVLSEAGKTEAACAAAEVLIAKDNSYDFLRFKYKCPDYFATPALHDIKTLNWEVNTGNIYRFTLFNIKGSSDNDLEFDWVMTSRPDLDGHIKITKEAMEKAVAQNNYFGPDLKNATLTNKTTAWVSKLVINDILKSNSCKIDVGNGEEVFTLVPNTSDNRDKEVFEDKITVKGEEKYLNTLHVKNTAGTRQLWILNDVNNPLIVKMDIEFGITLKSIE